MNREPLLDLIHQINTKEIRKFLSLKLKLKKTKFKFCMGLLENILTANIMITAPDRKALQRVKRASLTLLR